MSIITKKRVTKTVSVINENTTQTLAGFGTDIDVGSLDDTDNSVRLSISGWFSVDDLREASKVFNEMASALAERAGS